MEAAAGQAESTNLRPQEIEPPFVLAPPPCWPPRVHQEVAPWWVRLRDLVLTLLAWLAYLWILRDPVLASIAWLSPSLAAHLTAVFGEVPNIDVQPYLWVATGLVAWLFLSGMLRRRRLQSKASLDNVAQKLPPEDQFAAAGVPLAQVALVHAARRLCIDHDEQGRIVRVESGH